MSNNKVCCCPARTWAQIVAWLQIVGNVMLLIFGIVVYAILIAFFSESHTDADTRNTLLAVIIVAGIVITLTASVGITLGVILRKGIKERNWRRLQIWIWITCGVQLLNLVLLIVQLTTTDSDAGILSSYFIGIIIHAFFIGVVYIHKKELQQQEVAARKVGP